MQSRGGSNVQRWGEARASPSILLSWSSRFSWLSRSLDCWPLLLTFLRWPWLLTGIRDLHVDRLTCWPRVSDGCAGALWTCAAVCSVLSSTVVRGKRNRPKQQQWLYYPWALARGVCPWAKPSQGCVPERRLTWASDYSRVLDRGCLCWPTRTFF